MAAPTNSEAGDGVPFLRRLLPPLLLLLLLTTTGEARIPYADHCNTTVPEATPLPNLPAIPPAFFRFSAGRFVGGASLLGNDPNSSFAVRRSLSFTALKVYATTVPSTFKIKGYLSFSGSSVALGWKNTGRRLLRYGGVPWVRRRRRRSVTIAVEGFWSETTGKTCTVGEGRTVSAASSFEGNGLTLSAVFSFDYPKRSNASSSFVYGSVRSLDDVGSVNYFETIHMLVYAPHDYEYTLVSEARRMSYHGPDGGVEGVAVGRDGKVCSLLESVVRLDGLELESGDGCEGGKCGIFNGSGGISPRFMSLGRIECSDSGMVHLYLSFSDSDQRRMNSFVEPGLTLVGEGVWDEKSNRLNLVACRVLNYTEASLLGVSVRDCTIRVRLWFPRFLSITNRSILSGRIWSNRSSTDPGYFEMVSFHNVGDYVGAIPGMKYKFTRSEALRETCLKGKDMKSGRKSHYDSSYLSNLRFTFSFKNTNGKFAWGSAIPISIEDTLYNNFFIGADVMNLSKVPEMDNCFWNVSYKIELAYPVAFLPSEELSSISAEGIYNLGNGTLCMLGCRHMISSDGKMYLKKENLMDCSIAIDIQLPPLSRGEGRHLSGTIRSTRRRADPFYFTSLEISSYARLAAQTFWRIDLELVMDLVSLTLLCVCTGLQLCHARKHRHVLASISLTMLAILSLCHMVPLMLNFEALSPPTREKNVLFWSGGRMEVNEVIVRIVTMVALLLNLRLLQLTWSARSAGESKKTLQSAEGKALLLCLPLYAAGMLSARFLPSMSYGYLAPRTRSAGSVHISSWMELIPYVGLVLDGFLLPQIMVNLFSDIKGKPLSPAFYFGITAVRAMPHVYDSYRAHHYIHHFNAPYIYADPGGDFYSTTWDIIIPCVGVLFAIIIYLQQRFGGSCIVPWRFGESGGYATVSVDGS